MALQRYTAVARVLCLLLLPACFAPRVCAERPPLVLRVWRLPDMLSNAPSEMADQAVLKAFKARHPNIEPRQFSGISIAGQATDSQTLMAIAARLAPDVMHVNFRSSDTFIRQNFLYPLDEYVARIPREELDARVPKPAWPVIRRRGPDGSEHVWALPHASLIRALVYRKDLFREAGLDPDGAPRNWRELKDSARRLTDPEKGTYGIGLTLSADSGAWDWIGFLWSAGGEAMRLDAQGEWRAAFEGPEAAASLVYYASFITEKWTDARGRTQRGYCYQGDPAIMDRLWRDGKIAMRLQYLDASTMAGGYDPDLVGVAPLPTGPGGQRGAELNCSMLGIFGDVRGRDGYSAAEVRDAAWAFIEFYGNDEARRIRTRSLVEAGMGHVLNPILLEKYGYREYLKRVPAAWVEAFKTAMEHGRPEPYGKNCQMVYNFMTRPLNEYIELGRRDGLGHTPETQAATAQALLARAVAETNERMLGIVTPAERRVRNTTAFAVSVVVLGAFGYSVLRVLRIFTPEDARAGGRWRFGRYRWAYIILLPAVLTIVLWHYVPMLMGTAMVAQDYRIVGESQFIGVENFADVLWDATWWRSLALTAYYMLLIFCLGFWPPIALAILLQEVSHLKIFYRTVYYLPAMLSGLVVLYLWKLFFDPSEAGVLNQVIGVVGRAPVRWLEDSRLAMLCCVIPQVWAGAGPGCLIYLAALKAVPDDLYEAADLDGCGFGQKVRYIALPTLRSLIVIQFIATFISASQSSGWILVMTGMMDATKVTGLLIFERAYMYLRFGSAVTMAWILGVLLLSFTVQQLKILSRMEFRMTGARN